MKRMSGGRPWSPVLVTRILLGSYFSISRGVLADTVPKAVMHFLVNSVARGLQQHLIQSLYHPNLVPSLLQAGRMFRAHPTAYVSYAAVLTRSVSKAALTTTFT